MHIMKVLGPIAIRYACSENVGIVTRRIFNITVIWIVYATTMGTPWVYSCWHKMVCIQVQAIFVIFRIPPNKSPQYRGVHYRSRIVKPTLRIRIVPGEPSLVPNKTRRLWCAIIRQHHGSVPVAIVRITLLHGSRAVRHRRRAVDAVVRIEVGAPRVDQGQRLIHIGAICRATLERSRIRFCPMTPTAAQERRASASMSSMRRD
jgi:hypothetical protein